MSKRYKILWSSVAEHDLVEITNYIGHESIDTALEIIRKLRKKCNTLNVRPDRCRILPELALINITSYRELIAIPYRIVFRVEGDLIYILGVFDSRRDLEAVLINRIISSSK